MKKFAPWKLSGGTATRAEVYGLFIAAIVLVGGGVGGAVAFAVTDGFSASPTETLTDADLPTSSGTPGETGASAMPNPDGSTSGELGANPGGTDGSTQPAPSPSSSREDQFFGAPVEPLPPVRTVMAPNVIGWTYDQVREWTQSNLRRNPAWQDTNCYGTEYAPATVARQSPPPGTPIIDDFDPVTTSASTVGIAIWMERDSYVGPNWYAEGRCQY